MAEIKSWDEREHYVGGQQSSAIHTKKVTAETGAFEKRLTDKQAEIEKAAADKMAEEENKGFWGWLTTIGTTVGCMALTSGTMTPQCLALGTAAGGGARVITDLTSHAEGAPEGIDVSDAKYNKQAWANVEGDIQSQLDALIEFDENVWKQDVLLQASDTFTAYKWGTTLDSLGIFSSDVASADLVPDTDIEVDTGLNFSNLYDSPKIENL